MCIACEIVMMDIARIAEDERTTRAAEAAFACDTPNEPAKPEQQKAEESKP